MAHVSKEQQQDYGNEQKCDRRQAKKIAARELRQCLGNQRHTDLVKPDIFIGFIDHPINGIDDFVLSRILIEHQGDRRGVVVRGNQIVFEKLNPGDEGHEFFHGPVAGQVNRVLDARQPDDPLNAVDLFPGVFQTGDFFKVERIENIVAFDHHADDRFRSEDRLE